MVLPQPASHLRAPVLPCVEVPLGESTVLLAVAGARVLGGVGGGWGGTGQGNSCRALQPDPLDLLTMRCTSALLRESVCEVRRPFISTKAIAFAVIHHLSTAPRERECVCVCVGGWVGLCVRGTRACVHAGAFPRMCTQDTRRFQSPIVWGVRDGAARATPPPSRTLVGCPVDADGTAELCASVSPPLPPACGLEKPLIPRGTAGHTGRQTSSSCIWPRGTAAGTRRRIW